MSAQRNLGETMARILITGGAGFVGSNLATSFRSEDQETHVVVFDNLKRRGSETNLVKFKDFGIEFVHGDIRNSADLTDLSGEFDLLVEASAEPSVLAGVNGSPAYAIQTNLVGTLNCLEFARKRVKNVLFLSTSRVYSIKPLRELSLLEATTRFELDESKKIKGISKHGISEEFPTHLARSIYGATKFASELIIQEYVHTYGMKAVINRCGVIAGPGQFGKTDQGVFTHWVVNHYFKKSLKYTGFGGAGKQVRDLLHPYDLYILLKKQIQEMDQCSGEIYNIGGGTSVSTSLLELTSLCQKVTGNKVEIMSEPISAAVDIPYYITDYRRAGEKFSWKPERSVEIIVKEIADWIHTNESQLKTVFN
jgi:CDP-paratose 2-epimerase